MTPTFSPLAPLLVLLLAAPLGASEIGDPAPALGTIEWIKDQPVTLRDKLTVLQFWSTSAPTESVAHLSEVQHAHRERLQVVGLSSETAAVVRPFVDDLGGDMDYHVGIIDDAHASAWLGDDVQLPRLFIVDGEGRLAWRGQTADLDGILERLLGGSLDTRTLARLAPLQARLDQLTGGEHADPTADDEKALGITAEMLAIDPVDLQAIVARLWLAAQMQKPEVALATLVAVPTARLSANDANALALALLGEEDPPYRFPDHAYVFAKRARDLAPGKAAYHDTFARVLHQAGLIEEALAEQRRAVQLAPEEDALVAMAEFYEALLELRTRIAHDLAHPAPAVPVVVPGPAQPAPAAEPSIP